MDKKGASSVSKSRGRCTRPKVRNSQPIDPFQPTSQPNYYRPQPTPHQPIDTRKSTLQPNYYRPQPTPHQPIDTRKSILKNTDIQYKHNDKVKYYSPRQKNISSGFFAFKSLLKTPKKIPHFFKIDQMGVSDGDPFMESGSESYIEDMILELRTCFLKVEFQNVAKKLVERENILIKKYIELKIKSENEKKLLLFKNQELENEIERLKKVCEKKVRMYEEKFVDLDKRISLLEQSTAAPAPVENSRPPLSSEKGDSNRKTELKLREIIEIDDDSDDEDDQCISSILKRKRCSKEIKKECNSADNDLDCKSTLKTKRVSVEIKRELNDDYVDNIPTGTPDMNNLEKFHKQAPGSAEVKLNNIQSSFNVSNSSSGQHLEKIDGIYKSVLAKRKKQKQSWQFEEDMLKDFDKDNELCLNAVCALRRQKTIVHGSDIERLTYLTQLLTSGDSQRKLTKTASELNASDLADCRMLARKYCAQIFGIYQKENDPFFPPRS